MSATLVSSVLPSSLLHLRGEYYCFFVVQYGGEAVSGVPLGGEDGTGTPAASPIVYIYTLGVWVSRHRELKNKKLFLLFFWGLAS